MLKMWVERGLDKVEFDAKIREMSRSFPQEINRNGQSISDVCRWKATEFRSFLLYSGPITLKKAARSKIV